MRINKQTGVLMCFAGLLEICLTGLACSNAPAPIVEQPAESAGAVVEKPAELVASKPQDKPEGMNAESAEPKPTDAQERAKQLAKLTARAYREAGELSYESELWSDPPGLTLWCTVRHGLGLKCDFLVRDEKGLVYELHTHAEGPVVRIAEVNHRSDERAEYEFPAADFGCGGKWDVRCRKNINPCMFGGELIPWVGPDVYKPSFFQEVIAEGDHIGTDLVDGHLCDVVQTHRIEGLIELFYLDRSTHVVRRWKQTIRGATRDRIYHKAQLTGGPAASPTVETITHHDSPPCTAPANADADLPKCLAAQTAGAYREAGELSYEAELWFDPPGSTLWCTVRHGLGPKCDLVVRDEKGLVYELHTHAEGPVVRIAEVNHHGDERAEYEFPAADFAAARWNARCRKNINPCMFGGELIPWVGPDAHEPSFFEEAIGEADHIGTDLVDGHLCDVVQTHRVKDLVELFYLDRTTHVVRRWKHTIRGATRDRVYHKIQLTGGPAASPTVETITHHDSPPCTAPANADADLPKCLAAQTAGAYREAGELSYEAELWFDPPGSTLWCTVRHGLGLKCDLLVRDENGLVYELHTHAEGPVVRIAEVNHRGDERAEYEFPAADFGSGRKWDPRCEKNIDACMFGGELIPWVGPDVYRPSFLQEVIAEGDYIGTDHVDGHVCDVVQTHRVKDLVELFYLDRTTHVVRRWKHTIRGATRDRIYHKVQLTGGPAGAGR